MKAIFHQTKQTLGKALIVFTVFALFLYPAAIAADSLSDKEAELRRINDEIAQTKEYIRQKQSEIDTIQGEIDIRNAQIYEIELALSATMQEIAITEEEIANLNTKIKEQEENLTKQEDILWAGIVVLYKEGEISLIETILSSDDLSDVVDRSQYLSTIEKQVMETMDEIEKLKAALGEQKKQQELKKADLDILKNKQLTEKQNLASQKAAKNLLLQQTQGEQAQYQELLQKIQSQASKLSSEIYEIRRRMGGGEESHGGSSGYPYTAIDVPDPWLFLTRECTSYAAWKWNTVYGKSWYNTRPGQGSAWNWPALAADQGYSVGSNPIVGAIVSWPKSYGMPYGHVAIVEKVNSNGTIDVSEYNWTTPYGYSYRSNVVYESYGSARFIY